MAADALGFREATLHLTDAAIAYGLEAVLPDTLELGFVGYGRGKRARASMSDVQVIRFLESPDRSAIAEWTA
jgi:hypothetical protein